MDRRPMRAWCGTYRYFPDPLGDDTAVAEAIYHKGGGQYVLGAVRIVTSQTRSVTILRLWEMDCQYVLGAAAPKAPLCKGGCQKSLIFDWGIVQ